MSKSNPGVLILAAIFFLCFGLQTINAVEDKVSIEGKTMGFPTIQQAIDNAAEGDTVLVSPGEYNENLIVNVKGVKIKSVEKHVASIIGDEESPTITITADEVELDGFIIKGSGQGLLLVEEKKNIVISNNIFDGEGMEGREVWGINIYLAGLEIKNNLITHLTGTGLLIMEPRGNFKLVENEIFENYLGMDFFLTEEGTELDFSYNVFEDNYMHFSFNDPPLFDVDSFLRGNIFVDHYHLNFNEFKGKWEMVPCDHH